MQISGSLNITGSFLVNGGGVATTAGSDTQVQFNDDGDLGGDAGFTYDKDAGGSDEMKIYVNGAVDATGNYSTILDSTTKAPGIGAGYIYNASPDSPFEGNIANVYIYSKELSNYTFSN